MESSSECEVKLVEKIGHVFSFIAEIIKTLFQVMLALIVCVFILLASMKALELYNDAKVGLDAEITIHQRL